MYRKDADTAIVPNVTTELGREVLRHIVTSLGSDSHRLTPSRVFKGLALAVRDRLAANWVRTRRDFESERAKRVYYLSLEYLPGRFLIQNILGAGMEGEVREFLAEVGMELEELAEHEASPGLGNGGLGRLASCYMDSMAALRIPGHGYGIRYEYGLFEQRIEDGAQKEVADNWLRYGSIWQFDRPHFTYSVRFYGRVVQWMDDEGRLRHQWIDTRKVKAMACDFLVPGRDNGYTSNMRLWAAKATKGFNLQFFNVGDYVGALKEKIYSEDISMVLYPEDRTEEGRELRLMQQYFLVSATLQDIMRRHEKSGSPLAHLPEEAAIQLNETHPAVAIPELMRLLVDKHLMDWDEAWDICVRVFAYTNHTVLPEALETWPVPLMERVLPRHMQIIHEINRRFMDQVASRWPGNPERLERMSLILEGPEKKVRMAHLAMIGSHRINGVAELHTEILKRSVFQDFHDLFPARFVNVTNGVSPRRFLNQANPGLAGLVTRAIGPDWLSDLERLRDLTPMAGDPAFTQAWREVRQDNKKSLCRWIKASTGVEADPESLFDVQVKRIHEYKRQVLNVLHAVTLYNRIKDRQEYPASPRTILIGGKAAPGYSMAKLIIRLVVAVAKVVNSDPEMQGSLSMAFLPNYNVAMSERLIRACDLSEQISTAGMEASGTGNMKFALNGAVTIGTLDGANIEIRREVGHENFLDFGLTAEEVEANRAGGYNPRSFYEFNPELKRAVDMIDSGYFSPRRPDRFKPITRAMLDQGDWFMILADYASYMARQNEAGEMFRNPEEWSRRSILNTAGMGFFSSDRAVMEYVREIWNVRPMG